MNNVGPSFVKTAFLWQYNLVALAGAGMLSLAMLSPVPLLAAAGLELIYLGTIPALPLFRRRVLARARRERHSEQERLLQSLLAELSPSQQELYWQLRELRDRTLENYRRSAGGPLLLESTSNRIDGLLVSFLRLLDTLNGYRRYLSSADRTALEAERAQLLGELPPKAPANERLDEVKRRRLEILDRRLERFQKASESRELISHQLASLEDLLRLLHEQSITLRDPETIGAQLDTLSAEIEATDETVRQMERLMALTEELHRPALPSREQVK